MLIEAGKEATGRALVWMGEGHKRLAGRKGGTPHHFLHYGPPFRRE